VDSFLIVLICHPNVYSIAADCKVHHVIIVTRVISRQDPRAWIIIADIDRVIM